MTDRRGTSQNQDAARRIAERTDVLGIENPDQAYQTPEPTTTHTPTPVVDFFCTQCGRKLNECETVWLELDQRTGTYHDFKNVPTEWSQGWFVFGKACAAKRRRIARAAVQS